VAPTGGQKDILPPKVLKSSPENYSTHFKGSDISITFDEYFVLSDVSSQIYVSPFPGQKPDYKIHNKQLRIHFKEPLQENITYTIYFGNAIRDLNENNILQNYAFVFSTGPYLDSLFVKGVVSRAIDNSPLSNGIVALYFNNDDSIIYKNRPDYFTRTNTDGQFIIRNIKSHSYKVIAFDDTNQDLKYNDDEWIAFIDSTVLVKDTTLAIGLRLFKPQREKNILLSAKQNGIGKALLAFANPVSSLDIRMLHPAENVWNYSFNRSKDSILVYYNPAIKDSVVLHIRADELNDTATVIFKNAGVRTNKGTDTLTTYHNKPFNTNLVTDKQKQTLYYGNVLRLQLQDVVDTILNGALAIRNTLSKDLPVDIRLRYHEETHEQYIEILAAWEPDNNYILTIPRGCWRYKNGQLNDSTSLSFYYSDEQATGNLNLMIYGTGMNQDYILELTNKKNEVVYKERFNQDKKIAIKHLIPDTYKVKVIADSNGNGLFDTGSYTLRRQPEAVILFPNDIKVRANWDLDVELSLKNIRKK
jgi:uncharacterized protein (DUF2141 family)